MSHTFKDAAAREWTVRVTVDVIERVREIDVNLGDVSAETIRRLSVDDVLLVRSLWLVCQSQADKLGISAKQFGESMVGDPLDDAFDALRGAIEVFFPPRKRGFWAKTVKAMLADQAESLEMGIKVLDDPTTKAKMTEAKLTRINVEIKKALTQLRSATASPDSSE